MHSHGWRLKVWGAAITALFVAGCLGSGDSGSDGAPDEGSTAARIEGQLKSLFATGAPWDSVRAVLVTVDGSPVFEEYYASTANEHHNVYSITKSVLSTLIGIAVGEGQIADVDESLDALLPQYAKRMSPQVADTRLDQVLTMTGGFVPEDDPNGFAFMGAEDPTQAALNSADRPPGEFAYSDAGAHLVSAIVTTATGESVLKLARSRLFSPLGIETEPVTEPISTEGNLAPTVTAGFVWPVDIQGLHLGWGHMQLTPRDMAKLGNLYLNGGEWEGNEILPTDWVREATTGHVPVPGLAPPDAAYGYEWWSGEVRGEPEFGAVGFGGQRIMVAPGLAAVIVIAAEADPGNPDSGISPFDSAQIADEVIAVLQEQAQ